MKSATALVCNMNVLTPEQREAHILTTMQLIQSIQSVQEVEHGYQFFLPSGNEFMFRIAEFISNERLCCPFLKFTLTVLPGSDPITFSLSGPPGTQEFLKAEFAGAIP